MTIDQLLTIVACPVCHGALTLGSNELNCGACQITYEIKDNIPILIPPVPANPQ